MRKKILPLTVGDDRDSKRIREHLASFKPGEQLLITIEKNRAIRSVDQNSLYHMILKIYAIATGNHKDDFEFEFKMERHYKLKVDAETGEEKKIPLGTSDLDTKEMSVVINNLMDYGRHHFPAVIIPMRREDVTYQQWMEVENSYDEAQSGF